MTSCIIVISGLDYQSDLETAHNKTLMESIYCPRPAAAMPASKISVDRGSVRQ